MKKIITVQILSLEWFIKMASYFLPSRFKKACDFSIINCKKTASYLKKFHSQVDNQDV